MSNASLAAELQNKFDEALNHLKQKQYQEGIDLLLYVRQKGFVSAGLEANLGRAYAETNRSGDSVQHFMNAISLDRFNSSTRQDLELAQSKIENGVGLPSSHPAEIGNLISSYLRPAESLSLASICFVVLFSLMLIKKTSKKVVLSMAALALVFVGLSLFSTLSSSIYIVTQSTELKEEPREAADSKMTLPAGTRLRAVHRSGNFVEVERTNSFTGWVKEETLYKSPY